MKCVQKLYIKETDICRLDACSSKHTTPFNKPGIDAERQEMQQNSGAEKYLHVL